ncbi:hypothetical protein M3650_05280 [Paenibacillus sp. MER TA 81-3]|nr:hypothetical protein [Paenibacillus sp. MER TA 81-3]MCM3338064.1 hypothetical protein [Paenibacillus sp. MER TA 81-3]
MEQRGGCSESPPVRARHCPNGITYRLEKALIVLLRGIIHKKGALLK